MERKHFLLQLAAASGFTALSPTLWALTKNNGTLKVLVLGGTNFLGPAIVQQFLAQGHDVSLFNRGISRPDLFPSCSKFKGDRTEGATVYREVASQADAWDVVIDVWPQNPNYVQEAAEALHGSCRHYMFVSSIAVYRNYREPGMDESSELREATAFEPGNYNANKVLCERAVESAYGDHFTIVRPGAIVGDRDPGPFGVYVLRRLKEQPEIIAPDSNDPVQFIDAQDIARFLVNAAEKSVLGHFNLVGPAKPMGYRDMLQQARKALESEVQIVWMPPDFLMSDMKLEPFSQIPFWIPLAGDPEPGFYQISAQKAIDNGLTYTNYADTVRESYESVRLKRHIPEPESEAFFGIPAKRESKVLQAWKSR